MNEHENTGRFPDPFSAPADQPAAWGGELSVDWLLDAYSQGYFPWFNEGEPVLWWCPDPRFVLLPDQLKISRSLEKELKKSHWQITYDTAFEDVISQCAQASRPGQYGTWIIDSMIEAYLEMHNQGYAHSVECWRDGELVGGLYGISLGAVFFGESMFHKVSNASKVAFATFVPELKQAGFQMIDCQQPTDYLRSFGAEEWHREEFLVKLNELTQYKTKRGKWEAGALASL